MKNYYKLLHITREASLDEIKHAFRILAHKYHPDKAALDSSELFIELKEAYDILSNSTSRNEYDKTHTQYFKNDVTAVEEPATQNDLFNNKEIAELLDHLRKYNVDNYENIVMEDLNKELDKCMILLQKLKNNKQIDSASYLDISSTIVRNGINISQKIINKIIDVCLANPTNPFDKLPKQIAHEVTLDWLEKVKFYIFIPLRQFEMNQNTTDQYFIKDQFFEELRINLNKGILVNESNKKCYVATMVYKDQNHLNVILLRYYRDTVIESSILGRLFIRIYYKTSPSLVKIFENNYFINNLVRKVLDWFIVEIKKRNIID